MEQSGADDDIHLGGFKMHLGLEAIGYLGQLAAIHIGIIDDIIELFLSNGNGPDLVADARKGFTDAFQIEQRELFLADRFAGFVKDKDKRFVLSEF